jgi:hypothetical protein
VWSAHSSQLEASLGCRNNSSAELLLRYIGLLLGDCRGESKCAKSTEQEI